MCRYLVRAARRDPITKMLQVTSRWVTLAVGLSLVPVAVMATNPDPQALDAIISQAKRLELATDPFWWSLVHYRMTPLGRIESEADGTDFFLSPQGKGDPEAELEATIRRFWGPLREVTESDNHFRCGYPARYRWLRERLGIRPEQNEKVCEAYERWVASMRPARMVLVFAAAHSGAAASMFGHTFLRFDHVDRPQARLLSNSINFAAPETDAHWLAYAWQGITGGLQGRFGIRPYYVQVQSYSDIESRDLWEYTLNVSPDQMDWVLRHAWELDRTHFDYFFFTENCAYHILDLIEVAVGPLLRDEFLRFGVVPTDTLRVVLAQDNLVTERRFRPSRIRRLEALRQALTDEESRLVSALVEEPRSERLAALGAHSQNRQMLMLDAAHAYHEHRNALVDGSEVVPELRAESQSLLEARSRLRSPSEPVELVPPSAPEDGHGAARVGVGIGFQEGGTPTQQLWFRRSYHDLLDRPAGFAENSHLEMLALRLRIQPQAWDSRSTRGDTILLERLDLIRLASLVPVRSWGGGASWRGGLGYGVVEELGCFTWSCTALSLDAGLGVAMQTNMLDRELFYGFAEFVLGVGPAFKTVVGLAGRLALGTYLDLGPSLRLNLEARWLVSIESGLNRNSLLPDAVVGINLALTRNVAMRLEGFRRGETHEAQVTLLIYH